jgi:hypothetical protein
MPTANHDDDRCVKSLRERDSRRISSAPVLTLAAQPAGLGLARAERRDTTDVSYAPHPPQRAVPVAEVRRPPGHGDGAAQIGVGNHDLPDR